LKKVLAVLLTLLSLACGGGGGSSERTINLNITDVSQQPVDLTKALGVTCSSMTWILKEASNTGYVPGTDGSVSPAGIYTPPTCGSTYAGTAEHVTASGCGVLANITITSAPTQSTNVALLIPFASGTTACADAPAACWATKGLCTDGGGTTGASCSPATWPNTCATGQTCNLQVPACSGSSVQFYYEIVYTCGGAQYSTPPIPTPPASLPAACP
jgi:hypothetical protein